MKLTNILCRQHIGRQFDYLWHLKGKRRVNDTGAAKILKDKGFPVYEPKDILKTPKPPLVSEIPDYIPPPVKYDSTHPDWHNRICYTYKDSNVLLEGLDQAKVITKTVEVKEGLPDGISIKSLPSGFDKKVKRIIKSACLFDSEQQKLTKRKDPDRPAWNFPRDYGITIPRKNKLIISNLLHLIESTSPLEVISQRNILNDVQFWYPFEKAGDLIQLQLRGDSLLTASKPLPPATNSSTEDLELPSIDPLKHTITLNEENIYRILNFYPIDQLAPRCHPHTVFVNYDKTEVKNVFEEEVTEAQILGRSLMKAFTVAATYAKQTFGESIGELPKPVTVQCVQMDSQLFHFGVFQLNTLNLEEGGVKNVWYQTPRMPLFTECEYKAGKPILEGYNNEVIKHLVAFYNNV